MGCEAGRTGAGSSRAKSRNAAILTFEISRSGGSPPIWFTGQWAVFRASRVESRTHDVSHPLCGILFAGVGSLPQSWAAGWDPAASAHRHGHRTASATNPAMIAVAGRTVVTDLILCLPQGPVNLALSCALHCSAGPAVKPGAVAAAPLPLSQASGGRPRLPVETHVSYRGNRPIRPRLGERLRFGSGPGP